MVWHRDLPWIDPHRAACAFAYPHVPGAPVLALFDSCGPIGPQARHSYLCVDPFQVIIARDGRARVDDRPVPGEPLSVLGAALAGLDLIAGPGGHDPEGLPFQGGAAGWLSYELAADAERIAHASAGPDDPPDMCMGLYDLVIGFDRARRFCRIMSSGLPAPASGRADRAEARIAWALERLGQASAEPVPAAASLPALAWRADRDRAGHVARVRAVLEYIEAGDIYQANLTMRHVAPRPPGLEAGAVHGALRRANPAPFGGWLRAGKFDLCCSSPERFVRLGADGMLEARPIKGTAARHADPHADDAAAAALTASAKDRAENVMIVDVLRNDLGRVARAGSVSVPALCAPERFATVHHLVSTVLARLRPGLGGVDVLRAALPGGSITGAPKIRAMQIIAALEDGRRGPYCGSVAWIGLDGAMDSNIVIRSLLLTPERVIAQAGGGIVADSDPGAEYDEMMLKSAPMRGIFPDPAR